MTKRARVILQQGEQSLDAGHEKEGIRIAEERMAQVGRGEVEMIPWDEAMKGWPKQLK